LTGAGISKASGLPVYRGDGGAPSRFDVVLFGEPVDSMLGLKALALLGYCDLYISVGTSDLVAPASQMIELAQEAGARTVCVNPDPQGGGYDEYYIGKAEELLPELLGCT